MADGIKANKRALPVGKPDFRPRDEGGFRIKRQNVKNVIEDENTLGAEYIVDGPLRRVTPYYYTYLTYCKLRWRDRLLYDIFCSEFRDKTPQQYKTAIENGKVYVNNKVADMTTVVRNGDMISHQTHKHERPVTSRPIKIVFEDEDLMVIDKPAGIPAHPTGRFRYNTVAKVLFHEHGTVAHPCTRLDRLTSGLMFMAKTAKGAEKIAQQLREREVSKDYLARVVGEFPIEQVEFDGAIETADPKVTLNRVGPEGKPAKTIFNRISFNGQTSIVRCRPLTGRTHQIRVHLQYLGHPIANDPMYSNPQVWGPTLGKNGDFDAKEIAVKLDAIGKTEVAETWIHPKNEDGEKLLGEQCPECQMDLYTDPGENDLDLWLHAFNYKSADGTWGYETPLPDWVVEEHLPLMQMALDQARKCPPTTTAFSVGAVLVKDGKVLSTGYSRELPGNTHAEQCALEKYFKEHNVTDVPEGTVIYTTMEPCSERLSGNLPCVDRILKTRIKTVFVGVVEPDTFIKNNTGKSKLEESGVQYVCIPGLEAECLEAAKLGHST